MKPKVFITRKIPEAGINLLRQYCQVETYPGDSAISRHGLLEGVKSSQALLCLLTDKVDEEVILANPHLRVIANYAVGFDNINLAAATKRNIPVTNTPEVLTDAVTEYTFALIMAIARRIPEADRFTRAGKYQAWEPMLLLGRELKGKTLGIIGLGRIGSGVAERAAQGMGMKILYHDTKRDPQFEAKHNARFAELDSLLSEADFITLHVPLLPATRHLIGRKQLGLMKKTAYLINTSRGPVIDERALVDALKNGEIAGAALDVYEFEPELSEGLSELDNIILTPHIASATYETRAAMAELAASNILDALRGKLPQNLVNREIEKDFKKESLIG